MATTLDSDEVREACERLAESFRHLEAEIRNWRLGKTEGDRP